MSYYGCFTNKSLVAADGVFDHKGYTEKSLGRMVKAKHKADRAAARQANSANSTTPSNGHSASTAQASPPAQDPPVVENGSTEPQAPETDDLLPLPPKEPTLDRSELLRSQPVVVGRFMQLMVPILVDVYAASVITPVRVKTLTGLLKAVSFLDGENLKRVLTVSYSYPLI